MEKKNLLELEWELENAEGVVVVCAVDH